MKVGSSKPEEPAPMPAPTPSPEPEQNDGPPSDGGFGDDSESNSNDKPFNDEPFDAGVEADEKTDPKKFIEQLTGKLGQSLRKYNENQGQPDFELEKFALNSLISATHTAEMPEEDRDDIIKKINTSGKKDENNDNEPSDNESENEDGSNVNSSHAGSSDDFNPIGGTSGGGDAGSAMGGMNENMTNLFVNPKKNNMFQPNSNDVLNEVGDSKNYMYWQNLKTIAHAATELSNMDKTKVDGTIENGHAWVNDLISKASESLEEVYHFFTDNPQTNLKSDEKDTILDKNKLKNKLKEAFMSESVKDEETLSLNKDTKPNRKNKPFLPMLNVKKESKSINEKLEYKFYHKTLYDVIEEINRYLQERGLEGHGDFFPDISTGGISYGQTARTSKELMKDGKLLKARLQVQIYRMDNGNYELNMYIS